jgi:hypothetical protein
VVTRATEAACAATATSTWAPTDEALPNPTHGAVCKAKLAVDSTYQTMMCVERASVSVKKDKAACDAVNRDSTPACAQQHDCAHQGFLQTSDECEAKLTDAGTKACLYISSSGHERPGIQAKVRTSARLERLEGAR